MSYGSLGTKGEMSEVETWAQWKEEFNAIIASLDNTITAVKKEKDGAQRKALLQQAESDEYTAKGLLDRVSREIRSFGYHHKGKAQNELRNWRLSFDSRVEDLRILRSKPTSIDIEIDNKGSAPEPSAQSKEQRRRLLGTQAVVADTTRSLENTMQSLEQAVEIGTDTTTQLSGQGDQLRQGLLSIRETDSILERSRKTLERMRRRLVTNKLITIVIILVELGIVGLIVYLKYYR